MILLSLLGEQPIPNLIPLWQEPQRYSAVCFAATKTTQPVALSLAQAIAKDAQIKHIQVMEPLILEAYDIHQARAKLSAALAEYQLAGEEATLNLTGGTKVMSLAALQAAFGSGAPLLYVTSEENQIIHYHSDGSEIDRQPIQVKISVNQYLTAHGLEVSDNQAFNPNGPYSQIAPEKEGDWLEKEVERRARESGLFDDVRRNVFIRKQTKRGMVSNELDVVVTSNGRLAVCSCKSGINVNNDDLYEISSLSRRENAGIYCGQVLVCAHPPSAGVVERALSSRIHLVYGDEIKNAAEHLKAAVR